jgi:hypothetical protein
MKLTEVQIEQLKPIKAAYDKAHIELTKALLLVAGQNFKKFNLDLGKGELIIQDDIQDAEVVKP